MPLTAWFCAMAASEQVLVFGSIISSSQVFPPSIHNFCKFICNKLLGICTRLSEDGWPLRKARTLGVMLK